jgi:hypothetical protein
MNEKLYKLLQESKVSISSPRLFHGEVDIEKFAELIVLECASITDSAEPFLASDLIKEHFGIEDPKGWICPKCNADRTKIACPLGFGATVDGRCPMTVEAQ